MGSGPKTNDEIIPPTKDPTNPNPSVNKQPNGCRPGTNSLASDPAINPVIIHPMKLNIRTPPSILPEEIRNIQNGVA